MRNYWIDTPAKDSYFLAQVRDTIIWMSLDEHSSLRDLQAFSDLEKSVTYPERLEIENGAARLELFLFLNNKANNSNETLIYPILCV